MIVYADSSLIVRALLPDEADHASAVQLLDSPEHTFVSGSWSRVEVTAALTRAAVANRGEAGALIAAFEAIISRSGLVTLVDAEQAEIELLALSIVRRNGMRSLDAWHLACAQLAREKLDDGHEGFGFASRDTTQAEEARALGFTVL